MTSAPPPSPLVPLDDCCYRVGVGVCKVESPICWKGFHSESLFLGGGGRGELEGRTLPFNLINYSTSSSPSESTEHFQSTNIACQTSIADKHFYMNICTLRSRIHLSIIVDRICIQKYCYYSFLATIKPIDIICEYFMYHERTLNLTTTYRGGACAYINACLYV